MNNDLEWPNSSTVKGHSLMRVQSLLGHGQSLGDRRLAKAQAFFPTFYESLSAGVGIMPGWGLSQKLSRIVGLSRAREMSFTGRFVDAQTACQWGGLINRVVEPEALLEEAVALAEDIAFVDGAFLRSYGELIDEG
jgi:enoyl-CoA hydratase